MYYIYIYIERERERDSFSQSAVAVKKHRQHLYRGVRLPNKCPKYDRKQSDGNVPVMLELWGMLSIPSLVPSPL